MKNEMTSRERVREALNHKSTDKVPFSWGFGVNPPVRVKLGEYLGMKSLIEVDEYLKSFSDLEWSSPGYCGPTDRNMILADGSNIDLWGVMRRLVSYGDGFYDEIAHYPIGNVIDISDLDKHVWPSPEWARVDDLVDKILQIRKSKDVAIAIGNGNIFESSWYMRGFEQMLMDLVLEPELACSVACNTGGNTCGKRSCIHRCLPGGLSF